MSRARDPRVWARLTVDFADSPKIAALSDAAFRTLVEMILWARRMETDGVIPRTYADRRWGPRKTQSVSKSVTDPIGELLTNHPSRPSLTTDDGGDYVIHDFLEHQESAEDVRARKARNTANGKRGGRPRKTQSVSKSVTDSVPQSVTESPTQSSSRVQSTEEEVLRTSSLSPATPASTPTRQTKPRRRHKPSGPLPADWTPTAEHRARAAATGLDVNHEAAMFRAHAEANDRWQASWNGAFTTWLGKSAQRAAERRSRGGYRNQAQVTVDAARQAAAWDALHQPPPLALIEGELA